MGERLPRLAHHGLNSCVLCLLAAEVDVCHQTDVQVHQVLLWVVAHILPVWI